MFANFKVQDGEQNWADEFLDEEVKRVLAVRQHGAFLSVDITAHMEYFYNTLECDNRTQNPFFFAKNYPALQYPAKSASPGVLKTVLDVHMQALFPQLHLQEKSAKSTNDSGEALFSPVPRKYDWYPNNKIESPMKQMIAESPKPKSISSYGKHSGVVVRNDPITPQSVRAQELPTLSFGRAVSHVKGQVYGGLP